MLREMKISSREGELILKLFSRCVRFAIVIWSQFLRRRHHDVGIRNCGTCRKTSLTQLRVLSHVFVSLRNGCENQRCVERGFALWPTSLAVLWSVSHVPRREAVHVVHHASDKNKWLEPTPWAGLVYSGSRTVIFYNTWYIGALLIMHRSRFTVYRTSLDTRSLDLEESTNKRHYLFLNKESYILVSSYFPLVHVEKMWFCWR